MTEETEAPTATRLKADGKLKDKIENNPAVFFLTAIATGFAAGVGAYAGVLKIVNYEVLPSDTYQALVAAKQRPKVAQR